MAKVITKTFREIQEEGAIAPYGFTNVTPKWLKFKFVEMFGYTYAMGLTVERKWELVQVIKDMNND